MKKWTAAVLAAALMLSACGTAPAESTPSASSKEESTVSVSSETTTSTDGVITDMAGREIDLTGVEISKVYGTDPVAAITLYTLAPEMLLGWNYAFNDYEVSYILPEYRDLPIYGMGDEVNLEAIVADAPEACIQMGPITDSNIEKADTLSEQLGIPVIMVDGSLSATPEAYTFLGEVLGQEEAAAPLADYAADLLEKAAANQPETIPTVYYGNGSDSLETAPEGSPSAEVFQLLGADNVAKIELDGGSRVQITAEQLLSWDPQYIFVNGQPKENLTGPAAARAMLEDPTYSSLQAVASGQIYGVPKSPFAWVDRPTGPNRLAGIAWVGSILYPEVYGESMEDTIRSFYELFYHMELTDEQMTQLLEE